MLSCVTYGTRLGARVSPREEPLVEHAVLISRQRAPEAEHEAEHVLRVDHRVQVADLLLENLFCVLVFGDFYFPRRGRAREECPRETVKKGAVRATAFPTRGLINIAQKRESDCCCLDGGFDQRGKASKKNMEQEGETIPANYNHDTREKDRPGHRAPQKKINNWLLVWEGRVPGGGGRSAAALPGFFETKGAVLKGK